MAAESWGQAPNFTPKINASAVMANGGHQPPGAADHRRA
jgi:hypothetical protein